MGLARRKGLPTGKPLQRNTELRRGAPLARAAGLRPTPMPARTKPLRPRSAKTQRLYVTRTALVAQLFLYPTRCEVPGCTRRATDPHEPLTRARGGSVIDLDNITLICRQHHNEIHDKEPAWAYDLGFLINSWDGQQPPPGDLPTQ